MSSSTPSVRSDSIRPQRFPDGTCLSSSSPSTAARYSPAAPRVAPAYSATDASANRDTMDSGTIAEGSSVCELGRAVVSP